MQSDCLLQPCWYASTCVVLMRHGNLPLGWNTKMPSSSEVPLIFISPISPLLRFNRNYIDGFSFLWFLLLMQSYHLLIEIVTSWKNRKLPLGLDIIHHLCAKGFHCGLAGAVFACGQCRRVHFCGPSCQKGGWETWETWSWKWEMEPKKKNGSKSRYKFDDLPCFFLKLKSCVFGGML